MPSPKRPSISARDRARTPEAKEELRARILDAAVSMYAEEGYAGFTMRKLADRLGYTATTIYGYFENKDDLLIEVITRGYDKFQSYLDVPAGVPQQRLIAIAHAYVNFAFENRSLYTLMFLYRPGFLFDLAPEKVAARLGLLNGITETLRALPPFTGINDENLRHATELCWSLLHGLVSLTLTIPIFDESWARRNLEFMLETLQAWAESGVPFLPSNAR